MVLPSGSRSRLRRIAVILDSRQEPSNALPCAILSCPFQRLLRGLDPEVIIIETFRRILVGSENEAKDVTALANGGTSTAGRKNVDRLTSHEEAGQSSTVSSQRVY